MIKKEIIKICEKNEKFFSGIINNIEYEPRGMLNSELLLVVSLIKKMNLKHIIESGRARGYSTHVFCELFHNEDYKISSIDLDNSSEDAKYSEKMLKKYNNLDMIYGDSNEVIPKLIKDDCAIIIDGPKGDNALQLGLKLLNNEKVKVIFIHDLHKNTFHRNIFEILFNNYFCSDDLDFVDRFMYLDKNCWKKLKNKGENQYIRKGKKIDSYASTLGVIFNDKKAVNITNKSNYLKYYSESKKITLKKYIINKLNRKSLLYRIALKINKLIK